MATTTSADSKASSRLFDIASLENDGSNFSTWRYRVKTVLEIRGLLPIVDGTEPRPVPTTQDPKSTEIANWDSREGSDHAHHQGRASEQRHARYELERSLGQAE